MAEIRDADYEAEGDYPFTDDELGELAMAADPDAPLPGDAVAMPQFAGVVAGALPGWYMPPAMARVGARWRIALVIAIVVALVAIDAWGMCSTYGWVTPA
ncbi:MAG TPA: hypothetical protein VGP46_07520 [Acidimicrobiales bacterium]|jgi:hypothetical protein|nr:hypothetical protein [Acidimicrobiales bacterium]